MKGSGIKLFHTYSVEGLGTGIAINQSTGEVYVGDAKKNAVHELNSKGESLGSFGISTRERPRVSKHWVAVAVDSNGNVWVSSHLAGEVEEFSANGKPIKKILVEENENYPSGIAVANGRVYVDTYNELHNNGWLYKYTYAGTNAYQYILQISGDLHFNLAVEPNHDFIYAFGGKSVHESLLTEETKSEEESNCGFAARCDGIPVAEFGSEKLTGALDLAADPASHYLYVVDNGAGEVEKWTAPNPEYKAPPPPVTGTNAVTTIDYNVPVSGSSAPHNMSTSEVVKWGQKSEEAPVEATAIFPPDSPQGWPASSYTRASVYYLDEAGRLVNTANPSTGTYGSISTTEYNEYNDVTRTLSPDNRATALEAGTKSEEVASLLSTFNTYKTKCSKESEFNEEREAAEPGTRLCATEGPAHAVKYMAGKEQKEAPYARHHVRYFYDEKVPSEGPNKESFANQAFALMTESKSLTEIVNSKGGVEEEVEPRTTVTSYSGQNNLGWKLRAPTSVTAAAESEGAKVTHTTLYNENGQVTETRGPEGSGGESAHDSKIVYYGQEENKEYKECGNHPEWAGLVCETLTAKQPPEVTGVPKLPETTTTYSIWNEPEEIKETFPKTATFAEKTRTTKDKYDAAGRMESSEETSTATTETSDKALPKVTEVYNATMGVLEKQSTTAGETTKTITNVYNTLGQLESYTDADGNVAKFKYGGTENDRLPEEMSDGSNQGKSNQKYTYGTTTKQLTQLVDSAAGTFTASYDTEGKLSSEVYPNGMCANYTHNSMGEATGIEYVKSATCSEKSAGVWFSETKVASVRGETMSRTSTLASENYNYDTLGRLTEVQEIPASEFCKTRSYAYDEESNRTKLTAYGPNSKKECTNTEGGTEEKHSYDEANRLTDSGITYDPLGNITKLPAADAEGHALESTFYVDNAIATQTQNGVTNNYYMDPAGRTRETVTGSKKAITHYDGSGGAVAWTGEGLGETEKWTRNIPGIDGALTAVQKGEGKTGETAILQLHDLQGDVVATIKDKTGETKLESTYNSTEFGVPNGGKEPPKFAWLGAGDVESSLSSGVITEGATSYVPQTGMPLQSEQVAPPGLPDGSGGTPAGFIASPWNMQGAERVGAEAPGREAGREEEAAIAACEANPAACGEDPEGVGLAGQKELERGATTLREAAERAKNYPALLEYIPLVPGLPAKLAKAGGESYGMYIIKMAQTVEGCAIQAAVDFLGLGMCYVHLNVYTLNLRFITLEYPLSVSAEPCGPIFGTKRQYYECLPSGHRYQKSKSLYKVT